MYNISYMYQSFVVCNCILIKTLFNFNKKCQKYIFQNVTRIYILCSRAHFMFVFFFRFDFLIINNSSNEFSWTFL